MAEHAKFSASGSHRWLNCPGSISLTELAPPQRQSEYAAEGTLAHEVLETMMYSNFFRDKGPRQLPKKATKEMLEYTESTVYWVSNEINRLRDEQDYGIKILSEHRIDASPFTCPGQFGTLDIAIVQEHRELIVCDFKYGQGVAVEPEHNPQLIYYALGIAYEYDFAFKEISIVVDQPRAYHPSGETRRIWKTNPGELMEWADRFREGVKVASDPKAPLCAGEWCRFCPAATICPEIKNKAMKQAMVVFNDEEQKIESLPEPKAIAIPKLGAVLTACDQLEDWMSKVREHALHAAERGERIDGWKLVEKRSTRKFGDEAKAARLAGRLFGTAAFSKPELLSPAALERTIPKKDKAKLEKFLDQYCSSKSSGVTLVPASDKREEVRPLEQAFSDKPLITTLTSK